MKFQLIGGNHVQGDVTYTKGSIIESDRDLTKVFRGKFILVNEDGIQVVQTKPNIPIPEKFPALVGPEVVAPAAPRVLKSLGADMTVMFFDAKDTEFKIHQNGENYCIVKGDRILGSEFTKSEVEIFLKNNKNA